MRKIANTHELESELSKLIVEAKSPRPSRAQLAERLARLSQRVAGYSYGVDSMSVLFTQGRKLVPFNIDVIREISHIFVPVIADDGDEREGSVRFLDSDTSGPLTHYEEKQGKRRETRVDVQFPEGAERATLSALTALGKQFGFTVTPSTRGYVPQTVETKYVTRTRNKPFPFR